MSIFEAVKILKKTLKYSVKKNNNQLNITLKKESVVGVIEKKRKLRGVDGEGLNISQEKKHHYPEQGGRRASENKKKLRKK